ncbi:hypothetical protein [Acidianus manzaensis]|uniref:Uncharacterized protein n=1 Tax=Acidianus manzaensis TaxID=282676 RepID=A0A1W6K297_9CREN|nr:hypothetical protein [Acidianus manzaensis]ARM76582.1 hypothetical protein B6F84_11505 [Acidianus manzaensis]
MPYVEGNFCLPYEVNSINLGDIVVVKPSTIKSNGKLQVLPPLSLISDNCNRLLDSIFWVDGVKVKGKEDIKFYEGEIEVTSKINVLSPEFIPGYSLQKLLNNVTLKVHQNNYGVPILSIEDYPLVAVKNNQIIVNTKDYQILFKLLGYTVYYYISSEYSDEI